MKLDGCQVLVTGGAGFVGSHLSEALLKKGCNITIFDNLSNGHMENISHLSNGENDVNFIKEDVRKFEACLNAVEDVDIVFHEAAQINPVLAVEQPFYDFAVNAYGTLNLLEACRRKNVEKFIFASTNVYGNPKYLPVDENHPIELLSPYAASKLSGEGYCIVYHETYGLKTVRLRYTNIYGPRQSSRSGSGAVVIFIERVLKGEPPVIFGSGEHTRDFIYVDDVVEANLLAAEKSGDEGEVFNIGTGKETSINALSKLVLEIAQRGDLAPIYRPARSADFSRCAVEISKARSMLVFEPKISLKEGLKKTFHWYYNKLRSKRGKTRNEANHTFENS